MPSHRRVPLALGSANTDTEEARAFYCSRLKLFGGWVFLTSFLLTGTPVFSAKTIVELCAHHLPTAPEPPSSRAGVAFPPALERVILQCLAKSPDDRPRDARALRQALAGCALESPWSAAEAEEWWAAFRERKALQKAPRREPAPTNLTAVIDLANRVNPFR